MSARRLLVASVIGGKWFRFLTVGVVNTLVTLATIWLLRNAGMPDTPANGIGYLAGLALSFVGNRRFTFDHGGSSLPALVRFLVAFAGCWLLNVAVLHAGLRAGLDPMLAHLLGMPVYTLAFYVACVSWVFRIQEPTPIGNIPTVGGSHRS